MVGSQLARFGRVFALSRVARCSFFCSAVRSYKAQELIKEADVVIIGGGVIGTSVAYHLALRQAGRIVLLERDRIGYGQTSSAKSLLVYYHYVAPNFKRLITDSIDLYSRLEADGLPGDYFQQCGTVRLALNDQHLTEYKRYLSRVESRATLIDSRQLSSLHPLLNCDDIKFALYTPTDGQVTAGSLCQMLAKGAEQLGVCLYEDCPNLKTTYAGDGHWNIQTPKGDVRTHNVVVAAGLYGKESVKDTLKYELPLQFVQHQNFLTNPSPLLENIKLPVVEDPSGAYYVRQEGNRLVFGAFEKEQDVRLMTEWTETMRQHADELLKTDFAIVKGHYEQACRLVPGLRDMGIDRSWSEMLCMTPDGFPLVGPVVSHENYWIALGFADNLAYAAGIGKYLADWIVDGEPPFELSEAEPGRFHDWTDQRYSVAKTRESYSLHFGQFQPMSERPAGRPTVRVSGIFGALVRDGAHMEQISGWENPSYFGQKPDESVKREYDLAMQACGVIDQSSLSMTEIRGSGSHQFLEYMLVKAVPQAQKLVYSCLLTSKGRIVSQVKVIPQGFHGKQYLLVGDSSQEPINIRWLKFNVLEKKFHVEVTNVSQFLAAMSLIGPLCRNVLSKLTKMDVSEEGFPHMTSKLFRIAGVPVVVCHTSQTGELGFELYHNRADTFRIYEAVMDAGQPFGIGNIGWNAVNVLRMEKGIKTSGNELALDYNIVEAGLQDTIVDDKPDFLGRSSVQHLLTEKPRRRLILLKVDGSVPQNFIYLRERVISNDQEVGFVTSGCFSYHLNCPLCFAYISCDADIQALKVDIAGQQYAATYLPEAPVLPYFRRKLTATAAP